MFERVMMAWRANGFARGSGLKCLLLAGLAVSAATAMAQVQTEESKLWPDAPFLTFGSSLAAHSDFLVVGAPGVVGQGVSAFVYSINSDGTYSTLPKLIKPGAAESNQYGASVTMSSETILVGAPGCDCDVLSTFGSVYAFAQNAAGSWTFQQQLVSSDLAEFDEFGADVSISGDTAVIGSPLCQDDVRHLRKPIQ